MNRLKTSDMMAGLVLLVNIYFELMQDQSFYLRLVPCLVNGEDWCFMIELVFH